MGQRNEREPGETVLQVVQIPSPADISIAEVFVTAWLRLAVSDEAALV